MTNPDLNLKGRLWGCSLGPGDTGLITRRAWDLLQRSDGHWTYPVRGPGHASFALGIARAAGLEPPAASDALVFPMTHDRTKLVSAWAGTPDERVVRDLMQLRGETVNYLSLILVKNPNCRREPMIRGCAPKPISIADMAG